MQISQKKAMLLMALCAFLWSIGGLFIKLLPWHPAVICGIRSTIAASIILIYMKRMGYRLVLKDPLVWLSGLGLMGTMLLFVSANKLTTSANAIVLQSTSPLYIMVISALFFQARYSRRELVMVGVVMAGIALFFLDQLTPGGMLGNLLALCSGMTMALMFVCSSRLPDDQSSMSALVVGHTAAALAGMAPLPVPHPGGGKPPDRSRHPHPGRLSAGHPLHPLRHRRAALFPPLLLPAGDDRAPPQPGVGAGGAGGAAWFFCPHRWYNSPGHRHPLVGGQHQAGVTGIINNWT